MKLSFLVIGFILVSSFGAAQITRQMEEEPAHIYFTRVSKYATHAMFYVFDGDSLINVNEGVNWFRYDCQAGDHLLWITNRKYTDFVEAEVEAGKFYIIMIDVNIGYGKSSTRLRPLTIEDKDYQKR
jgi:hypothetical protein